MIYKTTNNILFKAITLMLVFAFSFNTISWGDISRVGTMDLQVQNMFSPIENIANREL